MADCMDDQDALSRDGRKYVKYESSYQSTQLLHFGAIS